MSRNTLLCGLVITSTACANKPPPAPATAATVASCEHVGDANVIIAEHPVVAAAGDFARSLNDGKCAEFHAHLDQAFGQVMTPAALTTLCADFAKQLGEVASIEIEALSRDAGVMTLGAEKGRIELQLTVDGDGRVSAMNATARPGATGESPRHLVD